MKENNPLENCAISFAERRNSLVGNKEIENLTCYRQKYRAILQSTCANDATENKCILNVCLRGGNCFSRVCCENLLQLYLVEEMKSATFICAIPCSASHCIVHGESMLIEIIPLHFNCLEF